MQIGRKREAGLLQSDLPKLVGLPANACHHHVLSLHSGGLVVRDHGSWLRKSSQRMDEDADDGSNDDGDSRAPSSLNKSSVTRSAVLKLPRFVRKKCEDDKDNDDVGDNPQKENTR